MARAIRDLFEGAGDAIKARRVTKRMGDYKSFNNMSRKEQRASDKSNFNELVELGKRKEAREKRRG